MTKVLLGRKLGMTQIFTEKGVKQVVTLLDVSDVVVARKGGNIDSHIELGMGKQRKSIKADLGNYKGLGFVPMFRRMFNTDSFSESLEIGTKLGANVFSIGDKVSVSGVNKGKGWQGVVKRWGFKGGPKTHGQSDKQRHPGSIGSGTTPGRVIKGMRMGGHMGNVNQTVTNMEVVYVDEAKNLIGLKGSIPGNKGGFVVLKGKATK